MRRKLTFCLLALSLVLAVPAAQADSEFSDADLRGSYGFSFELTILATGTRIVGIRQFTADGEGTFSGEGTTNAGGGPTPHTFECRYSVRPNGTGTATCRAIPFGQENFAFVLVDEGKEVHFISTTPGVLLRGVARRQSSSGRGDGSAKP